MVTPKPVDALDPSVVGVYTDYMSKYQCHVGLPKGD